MIYENESDVHSKELFENACRKENEEYSVPLNDIYYLESVDKKAFIYTKSDVYQTSHRLTELEKMIHGAGFVRVSRSVIINVEKLKGIKNLPNSKLEAILINDERICVNRNYLNDIRDILLRHGIDPNVLGEARIRGLQQKIEKQAGRPEGFQNLRRSGQKPATSREKTLEKQVRELQHQLAYTQQEVEFLKKIRMADLEAQKQWESKHRQK